MKSFKKLCALTIAILGLWAALPTDAEAGVCNDGLRFCLAGCTSFSPSSCRPNCYSQYNACKNQIGGGIQPEQPINN